MADLSGHFESPARKQNITIFGCACNMVGPWQQPCNLQTVNQRTWSNDIVAQVAVRWQCLVAVWAFVTSLHNRQIFLRLPLNIGSGGLRIKSFNNNYKWAIKHVFKNNLVKRAIWIYFFIHYRVSFGYLFLNGPTLTLETIAVGWGSFLVSQRFELQRWWLKVVTMQPFYLISLASWLLYFSFSTCESSSLFVFGFLIYIDKYIKATSNLSKIHI